MNTGKLLFFFMIPAAALLAACAARPTAAKKNAPENLIPANSPAFRYEGRFDTAIASAPVIIWQGSRIYSDFKGGKLALLFDRVEGQNFFNISVDGETSVIGLKPGETARAAWPEARLVLLRGGMYGGSQSPELGEVWKNAASDLEAADPAINRYVFAHWSETHPRAADHLALAGELTAWLKRQGFMEKYR